MRVTKLGLYLLILGSAISACKTRQVKTPRLSSLSETKKNSFSSIENLAVGSLKSRESVSGPSLKTRDLQVGPQLQGEHKSLSIEVKADPQADYLQFAVCALDESTTRTDSTMSEDKKDGSKKCDPDLEHPLTFAAEKHLYPISLEGKLEVHVRSCVAPARAINYLLPCGPWEKRLYYQAANDDASLHQLLVKAYKDGQKILDECEKIHAVLDEYRLKNSGSESPFDTLVDNYRHHVPPAACKELILSDNWQPLEEALRVENKKHTDGKDSGSVVMLSLGSVALISGFSAAAVGLYKYTNAAESGSHGANSSSSSSSTKLKNLPTNPSFKYLAAGTLSMIVGAILVGVSGLGLDAVTLADQQEVRAKLDEIYARIAVLRSQATASYPPPFLKTFEPQHSVV